MKLLILNGPNINLLGLREPEIYGTKNYAALLQYIDEHCKKVNMEYDVFQTNHEGVLVDKIQEAYGVYDGIVINPAAYTHTSIAIMDALIAVQIPAVEVHLSKVYEREAFRKISYAGMACQETYAGFGFEGYAMAIDYLRQHLK